MKKNCGCGGKPVIKDMNYRSPCPKITLSVLTTKNSLSKVTGKVTCHGTPMMGVIVTLSCSSDVINFSMNPVTTNDIGNFETTASVAAGIPPTDVTITASVISNGVPTSISFNHSFNLEK